MQCTFQASEREVSVTSTEYSVSSASRVGADFPAIAFARGLVTASSRSWPSLVRSRGSTGVSSVSALLCW